MLDYVSTIILVVHYLHQVNVMNGGDYVFISFSVVPSRLSVCSSVTS